MLFLDKLNLGEGFKRYFSIEPALDTSHKQEVFRIRHEVYCEELRFEPERPDRLETDHYDSHSLHCLLRSKRGVTVGCTRLVTAAPQAPDKPLPFELTCAETLDHGLLASMLADRRRVAEVSRLAVRAPFRRRRGERSTEAQLDDQDFGNVEQPRFPYILVGLYLGTVAMAARNGIDTLFMLTEPRLAAHFAKLGVEIRQIGGPVEHRGTRVPSVMEVERIIRGLRFFIRPLYRTIEEQIDAGYKTQQVQQASLSA